MSGYAGPAVLIWPSTLRLLVVVVVVVAAILMISETKWQNQRSKTEKLVVRTVYKDKKRGNKKRVKKTPGSLLAWAKGHAQHFRFFLPFFTSLTALSPTPDTLPTRFLHALFRLGPVRPTSGEDGCIKGKYRIHVNLGLN